ncbi:MAG: TonB-dependent receptor [Bacteroidales bacterium]|nr:TonB-dependent receptor [Bacteroidales bacterium]
MLKTFQRSKALIFLALFLEFPIYAQQATIHGYVKDKSNGEALIGANIYVKGSVKGVISNMYGFYSITIPVGKHTIVYSYIGYNDFEFDVTLKESVSQNVELEPLIRTIDEVIVTAKKQNQNITSSEMSVQKLDASTIEKIPVLFGEADVIKTLRLLPGVVGTGELSSNLSVRGGARDQNLLQLDEACVYNASHLLGIFSVFNNDAIKNVELYKGIMPAQYGGRISSLIDIRMKEGNMKKFSGVGSIGILTSKLTLEAPIKKDRAAILLAGRRTYLDLITRGLHKAIPDQVPDAVPLFFYDFNAKANYIINDRNRVYLSGYFGRDIFNLAIGDNGSMGYSWGNYTGTLRWNHVFNEKLFSNFTTFASNYDYLISVESTYGEKDEKTLAFDWKADLKDFGTKADFGYFLNTENTIRFGFISTYHVFNVGQVNGRSDSLTFNFDIPKYHAMEWAAYVGNEQKVGRFTLEYGIRIPFFQNIGPADYYILENYEVVDTSTYKKGETFNHYISFEPRFSASYTINEKQSIKIGYSRLSQFLNIASNSESGTPMDVWMPVSPYVKPQIANQVSAGYFRNFIDNALQSSIEVYYKHMENQIEFREFSEPFLNDQIEKEFRFGIGRAYGIEVLLKKPEGNLSGWISYTLSRSERKIKDIQEKDWYLSPFDITHNVAVVGTYTFTERWSASANWIYMTGRPFNAPVARWEYAGKILQYYGGRNKSRFPDSHRLDLGVELKNKPHKKYTSSWTFSIYNAYNHKNANIIYFDKTDEGSYNTAAYRIALLQRIYSIAYNFEF